MMRGARLLWLFCVCGLVTGKNENIPSNDIYCYSPQHSATHHDIAWKCDSSKKICSKTTIESDTNTTDCLMSLKVCQLVCDENASLWPKPSLLTFDRKLKPINVRDVSVHTKSPKQSDAVKNLIASLTHYLVDEINAKFKAEKPSNTGAELSVTFILDDGITSALTNNVNESYTLKINISDPQAWITIEAETYFGLHNGLETLLQLIIHDDVSNKALSPSQLIIHDGPAYTYRGILLDTSRSYYSVDSIKRLLRGMAYNKLNTFHWHITDSQSFPYRSKTYTKMVKFGAYSPSQVYTQRDIVEIVNYAKIRGIRVVPELDTPSHVGEGWQSFNNETAQVLLCFNSQPWREYCGEPPCGYLNPINLGVYEILKNLYAEFSELFESDLFHMGGDEVTFKCWNTTEAIIKWIREKKKEPTVQTFHELWAYFHNQAKAQLDAVTSTGTKKIILWTSSLTASENVTQFLHPQRFIVQVWTRGNDWQIAKLLNEGYDLILSNYDALYLDCGFGSWIGKGIDWCSPYNDWKKVYDNRPQTLLTDLNKTHTIANSEANKQILGAEVTLWSEESDSNSLDTRVWPRAAALAERLWSDPITGWENATNRLLNQRERMVVRNIGCEQVQPTYCLQNVGDCE